MNEAALEGIYNYRRLSDSITTAGQPTEAELITVAEAGFEVVVNLALHDAEYSLPDECKTVESLGMRYIHIPVVWERPTCDDLEKYFAVMQELANKHIFVHCAANKRVSVFMALYRVRQQAWLPDVTMPDVLAIWEPDSVWKDFMEKARQITQKHCYP